MRYSHRLVSPLLFACRPAEETDLPAFRTLLAEQPDAVFDLWIRYGTVIGGTGSAARPADLLIRGEEIVWGKWGTEEGCARLSKYSYLYHNCSRAGTLEPETRYPNTGLSHAAGSPP